MYNLVTFILVAKYSKCSAFETSIDYGFQVAITQMTREEQ